MIAHELLNRFLDLGCDPRKKPWILELIQVFFYSHFLNRAELVFLSCVFCGILMDLFTGDRNLDIQPALLVKLYTSLVLTLPTLLLDSISSSDSTYLLKLHYLPLLKVSVSSPSQDPACDISRFFIYAFSSSLQTLHYFHTTNFPYSP